MASIYIQAEAAPLAGPGPLVVLLVQPADKRLETWLDCVGCAGGAVTGDWQYGHIDTQHCVNIGHTAAP